MFEETVNIITEEVKRQLLNGADRIVLTVEKLDDDNAVIFCHPEYND
jgi:hypothetical protein